MRVKVLPGWCAVVRHFGGTDSA